MSKPETLDIPVVKPNIKIGKKTKRKLLSKVDDQGQVIVHCIFVNDGGNNLIRIWQSTCLIAKNSTHKSKLLHIENITMAPTWTVLKPMIPHCFTLIFSALPKNCKQFDFVEEISEPGGFVVRNIARNKTDVYTIQLL